MGEECRCPFCDEKLFIDAGKGVGDMVECPECISDLRVASLQPLKVEEVKDALADDEDNEGFEEGEADEDEKE